MAEYFVVPAAAANLAPIPDDLTDEQAVYTCDMLSTGFMGAEHAYLQFGETVAVFAQGAGRPVRHDRARTCSAPAGSSPSSPGPERQALAKRFGADDIVDFTQGDPVEQIMDAHRRRRASTPPSRRSASRQTFEACLRVTKAGGRVSNIGYHGENPQPLQLPLDAFGLGMNDKAIHTGLCPGGSERMSRLFRLMQTRPHRPDPDDHPPVRLRRDRARRSR